MFLQDAHGGIFFYRDWFVLNGSRKKIIVNMGIKPSMILLTSCQTGARDYTD